jgi:hypothetical protein
MLRTQPPGFRWLVGGFALLAALAFGLNHRSSDDPIDLILGVLCLVAAGYWLIFDREPAGGSSDDPAGGVLGEGPAEVPAEDAVGEPDGSGQSVADRQPDHRNPEGGR